MDKKNQQVYIIEHLEPRLFEWCLIEYEHISETVGKDNLWFTNIQEKDRKKLEKFGKVFSESVKTMNLKDVCVLDPEVDKALSHQETGSFRYFIFGGILGDYPPKKRTKEELTPFISEAQVRNIGKEQMSTDNAVYTVHQIAEGNDLNNLKFQNGISIDINEFESVELPYVYNLVNGKPFYSPKLVNYLKKKKGF